MGYQVYATYEDAERATEVVGRLEDVGFTAYVNEVDEKTFIVMYKDD
jgi:hypothetical protein